MDTRENRTTVMGTDQGIQLNELAAGALCKTMDIAAAVTQFAVSVPIGIGLVALDSVGKMLVNGTEGINTQFGALVNRVFGVRG